MLRLEGLGDRKVTALSGGQRQRVALGRALAVNPQILLLDEPLSNLDARIREEVRHEIKTLQPNPWHHHGACHARGRATDRTRPAEDGTR
jgi:ABC-type sugar transport system ATPase subunit